MTTNTIAITRAEIVEECKGCAKIHKCGYHCTAYLYPEAKWRIGKCSLATHVGQIVDKIEEKVRVGQKKSKRKDK